tara:strand:- start:216 stop:386 length:171 start_codon:yes stop_codon:yes gene_type:complete
MNKIKLLISKDGKFCVTKELDVSGDPMHKSVGYLVGYVQASLDSGCEVKYIEEGNE